MALEGTLATGEPVGCRWPWGPEDREQQRGLEPPRGVACERLPQGTTLGRLLTSVSGPACAAGMEYKECVSPCARTCQSLHINEVCQEQCVDGCSCPGNKVPALFIALRPCQYP